jgi:hypothetical protein
MIQNLNELSFAQIDDLIAQLRQAKAERAAKLYKEHGTLRAIAPLLGVSVETARALCHEAGVNTARKRAYKKREVKG